MDNGQNYDEIKWKQRGIKKRVLIEQVESQEELDQGIRWVWVEGADYKLEAHEILQWLGKYGTFEGKILPTTDSEQSTTKSNCKIWMIKCQHLK